MPITKTQADRAEHTGAGNFTILRDEGRGAVPGFGLRVTRNGAKAWILEYRLRGRKHRMTLRQYGTCTVDDARDAALEAWGEIAKGRDPLEAKRREREGDTLGDVAERYLSDLKARAEAGAARGRLAGWHSARGLWERHIPDGLRRKCAAAVTVDDCRRLHKRLADKPATADHVRTVLHAVLETARTEGLRSDNPAAAVKRYMKPGKRRRAPSLEELGRLGEVLRTVEATGKLMLTETVKVKGRGVEKEVEREVAREAAVALRLLVLTGMRRSELLGHPVKARRGPREGLRWADVDLEAATYRLEAHGGGSGGKGGGPRVLPLGKAALELLRSIRPDAADANPELPVVPAARQPPGKPPQPLVGLDRPRRRIFQAAGVEDCDAHCLRHVYESVAFEQAPSYAGALTGRALTRDNVLNSYLHVDLDALREVADKVAGKLAAALDGKLADVLPFAAKAAAEGAEE